MAGASFLNCFCSRAFWKAREPTLLAKYNPPGNRLPGFNMAQVIRSRCAAGG
jgi:hypothetical protein